MQNMQKNNEALYECPECGMNYREKEWADKCEAWCREHRSCNLDITSHAVTDESKNFLYEGR